eukprot:6051464-Amphidinium_carterae.3
MEGVIRALFIAMKLRSRKQLREVVSSTLSLVTAGVDVASMMQAAQQLPSTSALFRCQLFCDAAYCGYMAAWLARHTGIQTYDFIQGREFTLTPLVNASRLVSNFVYGCAKGVPPES